jgi:transcription elongation factor Elf1
MFPTLEKYRGTKSRHTCPTCNSRNCFVRYVDENGEYLSDDCGRCNRESKCGFHKKPKEFFADNPQIGSKFQPAAKRKTNTYQYTNLDAQICASIKTKSFDYIPLEKFKLTLGSYDQNTFVQFLLHLFPDCGEEIQDVLKMYFVGTYEDYTCLPQLDRQMRICKAKLIKFNPETGRRLKGKFDTSSLKTKLKLKEDFNYKQIFFGEHLLSRDINKLVAIVEAEKSAIIASLCFPEFVWLAIGSKQSLKVEKIKRLDNRQILLYPDADGFELWQTIATDARRQGLAVKVSSLIENHATAEQKANGYDLADYLISQQAEINQYNSFVDSYNVKLETVLSDESLKRDFETILDEQKAIAVYNGLSELEAERICTQLENIRSVALSV